MPMYQEAFLSNQQRALISLYSIMSLYSGPFSTSHGQQREFRIWNNAQKTKENDVKMILCSLAYITPIRLSFCISTGKRERERERERIFEEKKKIGQK